MPREAAFCFLEVTTLTHSKKLAWKAKVKASDYHSSDSTPEVNPGFLPKATGMTWPHQAFLTLTHVIFPSGKTCLVSCNTLPLHEGVQACSYCFSETHKRETSTHVIHEDRKNSSTKRGPHPLARDCSRSRHLERFVYAHFFSFHFTF